MCITPMNTPSLSIRGYDLRGLTQSQGFSSTTKKACLATSEVTTSMAGHVSHTTRSDPFEYVCMLTYSRASGVPMCRSYQDQFTPSITTVYGSILGGSTPPSITLMKKTYLENRATMCLKQPVRLDISCSVSVVSLEVGDVVSAVFGSSYMSRIDSLLGVEAYVAHRYNPNWYFVNVHRRPFTSSLSCACAKK